MLCPLKWQFDPAKVYTVGAGIKWSESRKGCISKIDIGGGMTRNFYYETPNGAKNISNWLSILQVESYIGTGGDIGGFDFWSIWPSSSVPKDIIGNTIHVEVTNPFMYEGAFLNPPKEKSIDVQSIGKEFYLADKEFGNGWSRYNGANIYSRAKWTPGSQSLSGLRHEIFAAMAHGSGTSKLVFHHTDFGVGNNDNIILMGRFCVTYVTATASQRGYGYAYEFYYQLFGTNQNIAAINGKLTELYKPSALTSTPSINYRSISSSSHIQELYLEIPNNVTSYGGRVFLEYTVAGDYGRGGTNNDYSFLPYWEN